MAIRFYFRFPGFQVRFPSFGVAVLRGRFPFSEFSGRFSVFGFVIRFRRSIFDKRSSCFGFSLSLSRFGFPFPNFRFRFRTQKFVRRLSARVFAVSTLVFVRFTAFCGCWSWKGGLGEAFRFLRGSIQLRRMGALSGLWSMAMSRCEHYARRREAGRTALLRVHRAISISDSRMNVRHCELVRIELPCPHERHHHQASRGNPSAAPAGGALDRS